MKQIIVNLFDQEFSYGENQVANYQIGIVAESSGTLTGTSYAIATGNDDGFFAIDNSGNLTLTAAGAAVGAAANDFEVGLNSFDLGIIISGSNGTENTSVTETVLVNITDLNDNLPRFTSGYRFSVAENTTAVGRITATDQDETGSLTFSFGGFVTRDDDGHAFTLDPQTGVLSFRTAPDFENPTDWDGNNDYDLVVKVSDGTNTTSQIVTVNVTDVEDNVDPLTGLTTEVVRFYRPGSNAHLYTSDLNEIAFFRSRPDVFREENISFRAGTNDHNGTLRGVRRFYNTRTDSHFFTMDETEIAIVQANQVAQGIFRDEGIAFYALKDTSPSLGSDVFRFSNTQTGAHFFTSSVEEKDEILSTLDFFPFHPFRFEGVGWEGGQA